ncbi:MAG TPA: hypothetical protein VEB42_05590 [Chitinophagaceae bacterium]|nr:hypothetical protein [Chitinophagaceae bacterium]
MQKPILVLITILLSLGLRAQVIVNVQLPAGGIYLKSQLWSMSLVNTSSQDANVTIEVLLTDVATNQPVLSGVSRIIQLKKGVTQINAASASPITYNVLNAAYNVDANPMGFLPIGVFNVCYLVTKLDGDNFERLTEDCETIEIEPLAPPMLMLPFDEDEIETSRPLFSWIAPSPQSLFYNIQYDLTLVEVLPTQQGSDAIQQNLPVLSQQNIGMTTYPFPAGYPELDSTKTYAWQITARSSASPIAKSEIWTFKIRNAVPDTGTIVNGIFYAKTNRQIDAAYTICNGILRYEYINELNEEAVNTTLFDISNSRKQVALDSAAYTMHF